jgi:hypothetical protein
VSKDRRRRRRWDGRPSRLLRRVYTELGVVNELYRDGERPIQVVIWRLFWSSSSLSLSSTGGSVCPARTSSGGRPAWGRSGEGSAPNSGVWEVRALTTPQVERRVSLHVSGLLSD